jgi:ABC-2 type transport system ATP-binding protein
VIEAAQLVKRYRTRQGELVAVDGISFDIGEGEFVGYVGPNGAGKSTTIKMMCGLLLPTSGSILVDGLQPWKQRKQLALRTGVVFGQRTQLWWDLPLKESYQLISKLYRIAPGDLARRIDHLDELLGIGRLLSSPVRTLSLGQRMRAELAGAVLPRPRVLFLDEPTIGLDVEAKASVRSFLAELNAEEGVTILLTTHDLGDIEELCRRLLIIDHGRVIHDGDLESLRDRYATERVIALDIRDDRPVEASGAELVRSSGHRHWLRVGRGDGQIAAVISQILAEHDVVDFTLEETEIEDIIRQIYREGRVRDSRLAP